MTSAGIDTKGLAIFNERGKRLALMDYGQHAARFGAPSVTIRRGVLSSLLLDAVRAEGIEIRFETAVGGIVPGAGEVVVNGESFDALIACDGLRSAVRASVFPEQPSPHYSGLVGTGGFAEVAEVAPTDGLMNMTFGRRAFFGYIKAPGQPVYWFDTYPAPESAGGPVADPKAYARDVADLHEEDPLENAAIMRRVESLERNYPIYDMPELSTWSKGRVLLMGDAAHAVAPHSGQGASMAIEDAVVLAACLEASDACDAFARFETLRRERTHRAIVIGRMSGSQKHAQSWLALRIRDLVLPLLMPMGVKAQERMFGFRADLTPLVQPQQ